MDTRGTPGETHQTRRSVYLQGLATNGFSVFSYRLQEGILLGCSLAKRKPSLPTADCRRLTAINKEMKHNAKRRKLERYPQTQSRRQDEQDHRREETWKNIHLPVGQLGWDLMTAGSSSFKNKCHEPSHSTIRYF